jgi:hypothetical protein
MTTADTAISVIARIGFMFCLLVSAAYIARWLYTRIPEGRVKDVLFRRLP